MGECNATMHTILCQIHAQCNDQFVALMQHRKDVNLPELEEYCGKYVVLCTDLFKQIEIIPQRNESEKAKDNQKQSEALTVSSIFCKLEAFMAMDTAQMDLA